MTGRVRASFIKDTEQDPGAVPMQSTKPNDGVVAIRPQGAVPTRQGLPAFVGVAAGTAGSTGICMNIVEIPAGASAEPHAHAGFETAIYLLEGSVETRWGHDLEHRIVTKPGDFLYIAAGVPHQPVNRGDVPARAVVARNTASEQESVVLHEMAA
jgi:uncharacterized RmlC-like cupin family protein